ncbi:MAG: thioredoxin family protein [Phycisphaera sp.]|nr:MAG: thioredoxin family protein [Phycisphaera sp.]
MDSTPSQPAEAATKPQKSLGGLITTAAIVVVAGLLMARMLIGGGTAPAPEFMPVTTDLASISFEGDKPIVAVVTADWCRPCQQLKRNALSDQRVRDLLASKAQPVMIDGTSYEASRPTLEQLRVRVFPSTIVVRDGQPIAMLEGAADADKYLAWLEAQL